MRKCDVCGNLYDKCFNLTIGEKVYTFDCFECAIHRAAPRCAHCSCRILGHGVESDGRYYCCLHCQREECEHPGFSSESAVEAG